MLSFLVFADLHYKKGMYAVKVQHLKQIMKRAHENNVDFVLHAGDFCNDYSGSPEIVKEYLKNEYDLSVYGVYGNHELESNHNSMEAVTPLLTNDRHVVWGTEDGSIQPGRIGYYWFEKKGCRIICADTNYSYNEKTQAWEHNRTASWGAPAGNRYPDSLGPEQLQWLESVLMDAAERKIPCVLVSHAGFTPGKAVTVNDLIWDRNHMHHEWPQDEQYKDTYIVHGHSPVQILFKSDSPIFYCDEHKIDLDMATFVTNKIALLDLDTLEIEKIFEDKTPKEED